MRRIGVLVWRISRGGLRVPRCDWTRVYAVSQAKAAAVARAMALAEEEVLPMIYGHTPPSL
jgi:hypothetical protein